MHKLHEMLEQIEERMCEELNQGIDCVDTDEFGKVADIYKDLMHAKKLYLEACYYKHVIEAMEEMDPEDERAKDYLDFAMKRYYKGQPRDSMGRFKKRGRMGYEEPYYHMTPEMMREHDPEYYRDMDRMEGRMYYTEPMMKEGYHPKNDKEGKSGPMRRTYMESKETHKANTPEDKAHKMKDLEAYMNELGNDITEMVTGATPEERALLKQKLQVLVQKMA